MAEEKPAAARIESIDLVRGLVMVIMALDHTRDFFHAGPMNPTDLQKIDAPLFLTRLVTHLCAPSFVFLAGVSAFLSGGGTMTGRRSLHLLLRGFLLLVFELTLVRWGWTFDWDFHHVTLQVIWALGWSMIALAGLAWLPRWALAAIGGGMILFHNLSDGPTQSWLWKILHVPGDFTVADTIRVRVLYPLIPWIGVMALGFAAGPEFARSERRTRRFLIAGVATLLAFIALRVTNLYGDASPWTAPAGRPGGYSLLAFVNTTKYPPSLLFLLMTLGAMFLLLAAAERWRGTDPARRALMVFGRVPLFFYLLHVPLIHGLAGLETRPAHGLPAVYGAWALVVALMWLPCVGYDRYKRTRKPAWTRFL